MSATVQPPRCPIHRSPMKPSQKGSDWYCPRKNEDGTYCKERAKSGAAPAPAPAVSSAPPPSRGSEVPGDAPGAPSPGSTTFERGMRACERCGMVRLIALMPECPICSDYGRLLVASRAWRASPRGKASK